MEDCTCFNMLPDPDCLVHPPGTPEGNRDYRVVWGVEKRTRPQSKWFRLPFVFDTEEEAERWRARRWDTGKTKVVRIVEKIPQTIAEFRLSLDGR